MVTKKGLKETGGKYNKQRKKKKNELQGQKRVVKLSEEEKKKTKKARGNNKKTFLLRAKSINLKNPADKKDKGQKIAIKNVIETPSNRFLARQNVLTKGTIVQTEKGKAKITNRPTQQGMINGVLLTE